MASIQDIEWSPCLLPETRNPELERELQGSGVESNPTIRYFLHLPWVARSLTVFRFHQGNLLHIDPAFGERVWLTVSQDQSCRYCYASMRAMLRFMGMPESRIRRLEQDLFTTDLKPEELLALELARKVSQANPHVTLADVEPLLQAGYEPAAVRELVLLAAITVTGNRYSTLPSLPVDYVESAPDRWYLKLISPLISRRLTRHHRRGTETTLTPENESGPFGYLVEALRGLPLSSHLRSLLDDAWVSTELSPRLRALIFGVIACGLECSLAEAEARRLLVGEGLSQADIDQIFAHLSSPHLTEDELTIIRFARETIRIQPAQIQEHAAQIRATLSPARFLDVVATAAVANGVARSGIVAEAF